MESIERSKECSDNCGRPYFGKATVSRTKVEVMFGTHVGLSSNVGNDCNFSIFLSSSKALICNLS